MPLNKLALIRYKTIDNCLQNTMRKWTLEDLVDACSDAIREYEGIARGISKRAIQLDLQNMRSEKLGYNAPIIVTDKKYYSYEDKKYSITNVPITRQDLGTLNEILDILRQFTGFEHFQELSGMVTRLEDKIYKQQNKGRSYIDFEKNELLKGIEHIAPLHKSIVNRKTLEISYRSFKANAPRVMTFYPHLLKEYRNRWFLLGVNKRGNAVTILALDRVEQFTELDREKYVPATVDISTYFKDVIGVSKMPNQVSQTVILKVVKEHAPYVLTKPLHPTQKILKELPDGIIFSIDVVWNFELEREILGFGEFIKVLGPARLHRKIKVRAEKIVEQYTGKKED